MQSKICLFCHNKFFKKPSRSAKRWLKEKYCSVLCSSKHLLVGKPGRHNQKHSEETKKILSNNHIGLQRREKHPNWKGGRGYTCSGYIWINIGGKLFLEHRLIIEQSISRKLRKEERVHHINGIKDDNRIENLLLLPNESAHWHEDEKVGRHNFTISGWNKGKRLSQEHINNIKLGYSKRKL